jgi:hypothetical protein
MPRFVVLEHDHPTTHWDLLLQADGVLRAWRLATPPTEGAAVAAEPSFDHRLHYLDYEGPVSSGRGRVARWDGGLLTWEADDANRLQVRLAGDRLHGVLRLERGAEGGWQATFTKEAAQTFNPPTPGAAKG